jgi:hypothetical protein
MERHLIIWNDYTESWRRRQLALTSATVGLRCLTVSGELYDSRSKPQLEWCDGQKYDPVVACEELVASLLQQPGKA